MKICANATNGTRQNSTMLKGFCRTILSRSVHSQNDSGRGSILASARKVVQGGLVSVPFATALPVSIAVPVPLTIGVPVAISFSIPLIVVVVVISSLVSLAGGDRLF